MTPHDRQIRATGARQLLENPLFTEAWGAVQDYLNAQALACSSDDAQKAQRIVISMQLLAAMKREIARIVQDGNIAQVELAEIEKKRSMLNRVFQR